MNNRFRIWIRAVLGVFVFSNLFLCKHGRLKRIATVQHIQMKSFRRKKKKKTFENLKFKIESQFEIFIWAIQRINHKFWY